MKTIFFKITGQFIFCFTGSFSRMWCPCTGPRQLWSAYLKRGEPMSGSSLKNWEILSRKQQMLPRTNQLPNSSKNLSSSLSTGKSSSTLNSFCCTLAVILLFYFVMCIEICNYLQFCTDTTSQLDHKEPVFSAELYAFVLNQPHGLYV